MATAFYTHPDCMLHEMGEWHPECPARLSAIQDQLIASRIDDLIVHETAPFASEVALGRVHTQAHIDYIRSMTPVDGYVEIDPDTLMNRDTWRGMRSTYTASSVSRSSISTCITATAPRRRSRTTSAC